MTTKITLPRETVEQLVGALEDIVSTHNMHCEHFKGVSKHSYNLANIAEVALTAGRAALSAEKKTVGTIGHTIPLGGIGPMTSTMVGREITAAKPLSTEQAQPEQGDARGSADWLGGANDMKPEQGERAELIKKMVDRFLGWKLPREFAPDGGITFNLSRYEGFPLPDCWPIGTNLFTAQQAKAMFEHCLGTDVLQSSRPERVQLTGSTDLKDWTPCMKLPVVVHVRQQRPGETHVSTREGLTPVKPDDLIMRGVSGEEYPIGRAIFEQTYTLTKGQQ